MCFINKIHHLEIENKYRKQKENVIDCISQKVVFLKILLFLLLQKKEKCFIIINSEYFTMIKCSFFPLRKHESCTEQNYH